MREEQVEETQLPFRMHLEWVIPEGERGLRVQSVVESLRTHRGHAVTLSVTVTDPSLRDLAYTIDDLTDVLKLYSWGPPTIKPG